MLLEYMEQDTLLPDGVECDKENDSPWRMVEMESVYFHDPTLEYFPEDWSPINVVNGCTSAAMGVAMGLVVVELLCDSSDRVAVNGTPCIVSALKSEVVTPSVPPGSTIIACSPMAQRRWFRRSSPVSLLSAFDSTVDSTVGGQLIWNNGMPVTHCVTRSEYLALSRESKPVLVEECEELLAQFDTCLDESLLLDDFEDFEQLVVSDILHDISHDSLQSTINIVADTAPKQPTIASKARKVGNVRVGRTKRRSTSKPSTVHVTITVESDKPIRIDKVPKRKARTTVEAGSVSIMCKIPVGASSKLWRGPPTGKSKHIGGHKIKKRKV